MEKLITLDYKSALKLVQTIEKNSELDVLRPLAYDIRKNLEKSEKQMEKVFRCQHEWNFKRIPNAPEWAEIRNMTPCSKCGLLYRSRNKKFESWKEDWSYSIEKSQS